MKTRDFSFDLPPEQIAQYPSQKRSGSRMMVLCRETGEIIHDSTRNLSNYLNAPMIMVRNNSRVRKARVYGRKRDGRVIEFLFISPTGDDTWEVMAGRAKSQRPGDRYELPGGIGAEIVSQRICDGSVLKTIRTDIPVGEEYFLEHGHVPLPPYMKRDDEQMDEQRYQTIYAKETGSVAAPTAGLHMTAEIEQELLERGIGIEEITLHVGVGTFIPIRTDEIESHTMHREIYTVPEGTAGKLNRAKDQNIPILAVGTTSMRTLESACAEGFFKAGTDSTGLYITPGYQFRAVDHLFTNFHTPESTLLVLTAAFAGREFILRAYREAQAQGYRFFSYGDGMLIL